MDIISEIDKRQKEIARLTDERAKAQAFVAEADARMLYLQGAIDMLKALGEAEKDLPPAPPGD